MKLNNFKSQKYFKEEEDEILDMIPPSTILKLKTKIKRRENRIKLKNHF